MREPLAVAAALCSALFFALATVLQHRSAARAPAGQGLRLGLLTHLAARPVWLVGMLVSAAGLGLHAVALGLGRLVVVQPLLVCGLLFALPATVLLDRRRPSITEWGWAAVLVVGLAVFLVAAAPAGGDEIPDDGRIVALGVADVLLVLGSAVLAYRTGRRHRAALLGLATGAAYGLTAALLKYSVALAAHGVGRLLSSWPPYALLIVGAAAILLNQAAYQAGPLAASLPPMTIADPLIAIIIGALAYGEILRSAPVAITGQVAGFLVMGWAVVQLARRSAETRAQPPAEPGSLPDGGKPRRSAGD